MPDTTTWEAIVLPQVISTSRELVGYVLYRNTMNPSAFFNFPQGKHLKAAVPEMSVRLACSQGLGIELNSLQQRYFEPGRFFFVGTVLVREISWMFNRKVNPSAPCPYGNEGEEGYFFSKEEFARLLAQNGIFRGHLKLLKQSELFDSVRQGILIV